MLEHKTVAPPNDPLGQFVHLDHRTVGVDDDDAGRNLVERASHNGGFPSEVA